MPLTPRSLSLWVLLCLVLLASTPLDASGAAVTENERTSWAASLALGQATDAPLPPAPNTNGTAPGQDVPAQEAAPTALPPDDNIDGGQVPPSTTLPSAPPPNVSTEGEQVPPPATSPAPEVDRNTDAPLESSTPSALAEIQAHVATEVVSFPATGDDIVAAADPYWYLTGDHAQGTRTLALNSVSGVRYTLLISNNALNTTGHVDLNLSINGVVVGSFSVVPGETSKTVSFFFPPISAPSYVIRLEETNTVDVGAGSIQLLPNLSTLTFYDSRTSLFPGTGDTVSVQSSPYWWNAGDYAEGTRTIGLDSITGVRYELVIADNALSATGHLDLNLSINGVVVGSFTLLPGETSRSLIFFFPPIAGPTYTIRLEETNTVAAGDGSATIPLDTSLVRFYDDASSWFPATGGPIGVGTDPYWWQVGDFAEMTRVTSLDHVTGVQFELLIENNALNTTGHVDLDLSINGVPVGSLTVLPGETSKSVEFFFPPVSGPIYTIRLEETNTVDPGAGSVAILPDTSAITLYDSTLSAFFPALGDVVKVQNQPNWWNAGDHAEGTRFTRFWTVTSLEYNLILSRNVLNSTGHVALDLSINGVVVGSLTVLPGEMSKTGRVTFAPISGPVHVIRLQETNTVDSGAGSIVIPLDRSFLRLGTSVFLPLVLR